MERELLTLYAELFSAADRAMYQAKQRGKTRLPSADEGQYAPEG